MNNQIDIRTFEFVIASETELLVTPELEAVLVLQRKRHERYRIIRDFRGPILGEVYSLDGKWRYGKFREEDRKIIPKAAFDRHEAIKKAGIPISQILMGHEVPPIESPDTSPRLEREVKFPQPLAIPSKPKTEIEWRKVAEVASKGVLAGMTGIATVAFYALTGVFLLVDPSYCVVLDDGIGTVVELLRWNKES